MIVLLESPYYSENPIIMARNLLYLQYCISDALASGAWPIATHALWTLAWEETHDNRSAALRARNKVAERVDQVWYYTDLGNSSGMRLAAANDHTNNRNIVFKRLSQKYADKFYRGEAVQSGVVISSRS